MADYQYVRGVDAVEKNLLEFPVKIEQKVVRGGLREMGKAMMKAIAPLVPVGRGIAHKDATSDLRGTLRVTTKKKGKTITASVRIGDRKKGVFYAHMVMGGTKPHLIKATGRPKRRTRRGERDISLGTVNKWIARGVLAVGDRILGTTVHHPGARGNDFMARGFAAGHEEALKAGFAYYDAQVKKIADEDNR